MRLLIIGLLIVAVVIAGAVAFIATSFVDEKESAVEQALKRESKTKVLVAAVQLPIGSSLVRESFRWQPWPEDGLDKSYLVFSGRENVDEDFLGAIVRYPIAQGEPITAQRLIKKDAPGVMAAILAPGQRALTIKVSALTASGGFILPGDYVDLVLTHGMYAKEYKKELNGSSKVREEDIGKWAVLKTTSETFMRNVRVLAVDTVVGKVEGIARPSKSLTLEVTAKDAEMLITAASMGKISAVLRPVADATKTDEPLTATHDIEVSPMLRAFLSGKTFGANVQMPAVVFTPPPVQKQMAKKPNPVIAPPPKKMAPPPVIKRTKKAAAPAKTKSDPWTVKIFRGGSSNPEEISGKVEELTDK